MDTGRSKKNNYSLVYPKGRKAVYFDLSASDLILMFNKGSLPVFGAVLIIKYKNEIRAAAREMLSQSVICILIGSLGTDWAYQEKVTRHFQPPRLEPYFCSNLPWP